MSNETQNQQPEIQVKQSFTQKVKEHLPGTKRHKLKKGLEKSLENKERRGSLGGTCDPESREMAATDCAQGCQQQMPSSTEHQELPQRRGSIGGTCDPEAREQYASKV